MDGSLCPLFSGEQQLCVTSALVSGWVVPGDDGLCEGVWKESVCFQGVKDLLQGLKG